MDSPAAPPPPPAPPPIYGPPPMYMPVKPRTGVPVAAGVLLIIAGVLGLVGLALSFILVGGLFSFLPFVGGILGTLFLICGIIVSVFSIFALVGGIMALRRRMWGLALTGSILGLFALGPWGIASILSLVALILVVVSHDEFT